MVETKYEVKSEDTMENGNQVKSVTAVRSEKGVKRSIEKNGVAVGNMADQYNIVINTEDRQPFLNKAGGVHCIY